MSMIKERLKQEISRLPNLSKIAIYHQLYQDKYPLLLGVREWIKARQGGAKKEMFHDLFVDYSNGASINGAENILEVLINFDVVSFDLFDTVLFRSVKRPTDIFQLMERQLGLPGFAQQREQAEWATRQKKYCCTGNWEITFQEIYNTLPPFAGHEKRELQQVELDIEAKQLTINPVIRQVVEGLQERGQRIIAISDMYLGASTLKAFLRGCNFPLTEEIYVSSEHGVSKSDGRLFEVVSGLESLQNQKIVHIGDDFYRDVCGGKEHGICCIHYLR